MKEIYEVINVDDYLNVRDTPNSGNYNLNIIARLNSGDYVEKHSDHFDHRTWIKIRKEINKGELVGYVAKRYLKKLSNPPKYPLYDRLQEIHLEENRLNITLDNKDGRAYPIGVKNRPKRNKKSIATKVSSIHKIVDWLDVENSDRYKATARSTYCNIYAYDFAYLTGVYLPRVWWRSTAINTLIKSNIKRGKNKSVEARYGITLEEMNANNLHIWFEEYGEIFGWKRYFNVNDFQLEVNKGKIGIITAKQMNTSQSGHITAAIPENNVHKAKRNTSNEVIIPLQSQAGRTNKKYFAGLNGEKWWTKRNYRDFGLWLHD